MEPSYFKLWESGELRARTQMAWGLLASCCLCPRNCRVDRLQGTTGFCGQGSRTKVARALPHFGEEPPLSGNHGAGTVFFSGCALRCLYCQNYQISQEGFGKELSPEELAQCFLDLQNQGCHNLDLVSPTPHLPFIFSALEFAIPLGFRLPLIYNTHGYLSQNTLDLLEGIVDIYLPDMKYGDHRNAALLSQVNDYPLLNLAAVKKMFRQVGPLQTDEEGMACRGLLVRHLILPGHRADSRDILKALADLSREIPLSLMAQYRPCFKAGKVPAIDRPLHPHEYREIMDLAQQLEFEEVFIQEMESADLYYPDFTREHPFR